MTLISADGVLLEVHSRKEGCYAWTLVATTSQILALSQLLLQTLMNVSLSWFISNPCFTTYYCLCIFYSQPSTLLKPCLSSIPVGVCRHHEDRVPPHTSSKSRQGAGRVSTRCHISCSFGPHLPVEVGFGATTCPVAPNLTSLLRLAPVLPRGPWPQASSPC
jgi:hypothetical protein